MHQPEMKKYERQIKYTQRANQGRQSYDGSRLTLVGCFLLAQIICGCSGKGRDDKMVFHYNQPEGISSLDPAFAKNQAVMWAVHQLYNTLIETNSELLPAPSLASRWEISKDRLVYTFYLRTDVFFHRDQAFGQAQTRRLNASDVAYSLKRIMDRQTASPGAWIFNGKVDPQDAFNVLNDSVFQLKLLRPYNPILGILSMQYCSIIPHEAVEYYGNDFRKHPVGTGPFSFSAWEEGQALIMLKNENYFEKDDSGTRLPYLDAIKVSFLDSKATEFLEFQQGRLDFINDIDASFKDEVLTKKGELRKDWVGKILLHKHTYLTTEYLGILVDSNNAILSNSPLRLRKIRQAINYGFDRRKMMMYLRNSIGVPAESGFIPAGLPSFDSSAVKGYHYDPAKVKTLLGEAGYPGGNGLPVIKLLTVPTYAELANFIAKELQENGIHVQVEAVQKSLLLEQTAKSQALFFRGSWIGDYPDAENFLNVFYGKNPAPPNYTRYHNPEFDRLFEKALEAPDIPSQNIMYQQLDQLVMNDAPVVPLWYDMVIHLVNPRVRNFEPNSLNLLELRHTSIGKLR